MYDEAIAGFQKGITPRGGSEWSISMPGLGHVYAVSGKKGEARAVLDELKQLSGQEYVPAYSIALIYAGLGEKDQAFAWLEKAYEEHSFQMAWLKVEPRWDSLRSDPRFAGVLFTTSPADGQRFLVNTRTDAQPLPITVVVNWTAQLKKN